MHVAGNLGPGKLNLNPVEVNQDAGIGGGPPASFPGGLTGRQKPRQRHPGQAQASDLKQVTA